MGGAWRGWVSAFSGRAGVVQVNNGKRVARKSFLQRLRGRVCGLLHPMNSRVDTLHVSRKDPTLAHVQRLEFRAFQ
jgi:hypothetical protein